MTDTELWIEFVRALIARVGAPASAVSVDTFWAWAQAETAPFPLMRWFNPMNTTEPWLGARDSGAQPGAHDVKIYASLADGVAATAYTLLNEPYYSNIVANLRAGIPRQRWGATSAAGAQLHAWGTGTNWLTARYPLPPTVYVFSAPPQTLAQTPKRRSFFVTAGSTLHQFVRGTPGADGNRQLFHRRRVAGSWSAWQSLGGVIGVDDLGSEIISGGYDDQGALVVTVTGSDSKSLWDIISSDDGQTWGAYVSSQGAGDGLVTFSGTAPVPAQPPPGSVTVDFSPVLNAIADLKAHPSIASDPVLLGKVISIEANLNAPRPPA